MKINNKFSVAIATYNEELNIKRCLDNITSYTDDIVIVDGGSNDKTVEIASKYTRKIIVTDNPKIFHINKQKAVDNTKYTWVLQLDADEVVTEELALEISKVINLNDQEKADYSSSVYNNLFKKHEKNLRLVNDSANTIINAYFISRINYFLGGTIKYAGTYPDGVIRLINKKYAHFPCKSVHEQIYVNGKISWLKNSLIHYSNPNLAKYIQNAERYTDLEAGKIKNYKYSLILLLNYVIYKPIYIFLSLFIRHKGFLDGWRGLVFSFFSCLHYPVIYLKYIFK